MASVSGDNKVDALVYSGVHKCTISELIYKEAAVVHDEILSCDACSHEHRANGKVPLRPIKPIGLFPSIIVALDSYKGTGTRFFSFVVV